MALIVIQMTSLQQNICVGIVLLQNDRAHSFKRCRSLLEMDFQGFAVFYLVIFYIKYHIRGYCSLEKKEIDH